MLCFKGGIFGVGAAPLSISCVEVTCLMVFHFVFRGIQKAVRATYDASPTSIDRHSLA